MIGIAVCVLVTSLDAGAAAPEPTYTDEQLERCGTNIAHVKRIESKAFNLPEDKAVALDEAKKYLRLCLDVWSSQPFDRAERAARAKCPCKVADVEWSDEESKDCRPNIEEYFRSTLIRGLTVAPGTEVSGLIDDIRSCLLRSKAKRAHLLRDQDEERRAVPATVAIPEPVDNQDDGPQEPVPPPAQPRTLSAADRKARAAKRAEREVQKQEVAAAVAKASDAFCGPAPERRAWSGIYAGLERAYKDVAHDPDSIEFLGCSELVKKNPPTCWLTACRVRGKNAFGAKVLSVEAFGESHLGWRRIESR